VSRPTVEHLEQIVESQLCGTNEHVRLGREDDFFEFTLLVSSSQVL
jgi:hypothetical protein